MSTAMLRTPMPQDPWKWHSLALVQVWVSKNEQLDNCVQKPSITASSSEMTAAWDCSLTKASFKNQLNQAPCSVVCNKPASSIETDKINWMRCWIAGGGTSLSEHPWPILSQLFCMLWVCPFFITSLFQSDFQTTMWLHYYLYGSSWPCP